jgi:hypothetical protein
VLLNGNILTGEFNQLINEFTLQRVKHFNLESTINESQLNMLYDYLKKHQNDPDGQIITLYDQLPVWLSQQEINLLLNDLEKIQSMYDKGN